MQVAQATELIHALRNLTVPVVLCGDFNSDANFGSGIDATPSAALIEAAGYADTWRIVNPNDPGATWPLFLEDQPPPDFFAPFLPFERIDLFFSRGMQVISTVRLDNKSRMNREVHVRFGEGLGVKFPRATRLLDI